MSEKLALIDADVLTVDEKNELNSNIDSIIAAHKNNRQEINRLVFESVAAMTAADDAQSQLSSKGFFSRLWGGITGSNQALQNKINSNRAAAQYASQQTLQKLAEQNLMTFDLITAVNNKLNASIGAIGEEFTKIYDGLGKFFTHNRNEMVRMETRLAKVEQNVRLLTWQNSIEYLDFDGEEYVDMDDIKKIVCLVRDFYDITQGNWSTFDLLLLKTAMATIDIQPKSKVNYFHVLKEIENNTMLKNKFLGGMEIQPISDPSYLISMSIIKKMDSLKNEEFSTVKILTEFLNNHDTFISQVISQEKVCEDLARQYIKDMAHIDIDIEIDSYDMVLDLLYNLKQASEEEILICPEALLESKDVQLCQAESLYLSGQYREAFEKSKLLAGNGNGRAMYLMYRFYRYKHENCVEPNKEKQILWLERGAAVHEPLCIWCKFVLKEKSEKVSEDINDIIAMISAWEKICKIAETGDSFAQYEVANWYYWYMKNYMEAFNWYLKSASQGDVQALLMLSQLHDLGNGELDKNNDKVETYCRKAAEKGLVDAQVILGNIYYRKKGIEKGRCMQWYIKAAKQGNAEAQYKLGNIYFYGLMGVKEDKVKGIELYKASAKQGYVEAQYRLGDIYRYGITGIIKEDKEESLKWYRSAAGQGYVEAQYEIGYYFYLCDVMRGRIPAIEESEAIKWVENAAAQGSYMAAWGLFMYYSGKSMGWDAWDVLDEMDEREATIWLQKHYNNDRIGGKKVIEWLQKWADLDSQGSQELASFYKEGIIVEQDYKKAIKYYLKAADTSQHDFDFKNCLNNLKEIFSRI